MLEVFCGSDVVKVRESAFQRIDEVVKKGFSLNLIDSDSFQEGVLKDAVGATSLFGKPELYVLDTPGQSKDFQSEVENLIPAMAESYNQFILIEGKLLASQKKKLAKVDTNIEEFNAASTSNFNPFSLAEALARRDKKTLWILLNESNRAGMKIEETIGILWWQMKSLLLASRTQSAGEAGMKDFPYRKAKQALSRFKEGEVEKLSESLLLLYHQGHAGEVETDLALERWVLAI